MALLGGTAFILNFESAEATFKSSCTPQLSIAKASCGGGARVCCFSTANKHP